MVLVQKWPFFQIFFLMQYCNKAIKTIRSKIEKLTFIQKGLSHGFCAKMIIYLTFFFFGNIDEENIFFDILKGKNTFLGYKKINKTFKKSKNWHFSKGVNPRFWSKNGHFSNFVFLGNIGQENVFYDILERKNAFLGYKNKTFKKSKNWHFFRGVKPLVLVQKWPLFQHFF